MKGYGELSAYKKAIDRTRPFTGETLRELREYYRIGLTYSSNAIEGNSLTEVETKVLLEDGLTVGGKPLREVYEAVGHSAAFDYMLTLTSARSITVSDIKTLHRLFYQKIDEKHAGVWRDIPIIVTGTDFVFPAPEELPGLMNSLEEWITDNRGRLNPIEFAAMLHLKFVTIHPFIDGNGRVARLLMNTALIEDGYLLAVIPPLLRSEYISAIRLYQQKGNASPFIDFIAERVLESYREVSRLLRIPII
ncbi:MAG: Fic family protein [Ruminococcus sp.]|jgi:Fic family protein|nr:Fic family protein [Ruminococcus sp.]